MPIDTGDPMAQKIGGAVLKALTGYTGTSTDIHAFIVSVVDKLIGCNMKNPKETSGRDFFSDVEDVVGEVEVGKGLEDLLDAALRMAAFPFQLKRRYLIRVTAAKRSRPGRLPSFEAAASKEGLKWTCVFDEFGGGFILTIYAIGPLQRTLSGEPLMEDAQRPPEWMGSFERTGIVRSMDGLGRIVVPMELRRLLDVMDGDEFEILIDREEQMLVFRKNRQRCIFCTRHWELVRWQGRWACRSCVLELAKLAG